MTTISFSSFSYTRFSREMMLKASEAPLTIRTWLLVPIARHFKTKTISNKWETGQLLLYCKYYKMDIKSKPYMGLTIAVL